MQGSFSEESLQIFHHLASENFSEAENYDFTRCVRPDGSSFGTAGKCLPPNIPVNPTKLKTEASEDEQHAARLMAGGRKHNRSIQRLARELRERARKKREQAG